MAPYQAIKQYCRECMNGMSHEVKKCTSPDCFWYDWRFKKQPGSTIKAIRQYCLNECVGEEVAGRYKEVKECNPRFGCSLHAFRMGKNPNYKGLTQEEKSRRIDILRSNRKLISSHKNTSE